MKYAIFSDLHLGNNKNNPIFHDISLKYAEWIKNKLIEKNITNIIICGDVFHDRVSLNLTTIDCSYKFFEILKNFNIQIICGNHDAWFLDNSSIHSLSLFKNWSNIIIYDTPTLNGDFFFSPWGTDPSQIQQSKFVISHVEVSSFEMSKNKVCSNGIKAKDLVDKADKLVISGHFHKPQGRKYGDKIFLYTGSAFQLSWGESGDDKFFYILDTDTCKIEKIKNDVSPRFEYIKTEKDFDKIANNFISIQIENNEEGEKLLSKIAAFNPIDIKSQIIEQDITETTEDLSDFKVIDIVELIPEFINNLENLSVDEKEETIKLLNNIYKDCKL